MKYKKIVLFSFIASLMLLSACAKNYGPHAKTAVMQTPDCMDWIDTVIEMRRILDNKAEGIHNYYIDQVAATIRVTYDTRITSAEKIAQILRDEEFTIDWIEIIDY